MADPQPVERIPLSPEDLTMLMALKAEAEQHHAAANAIEHAHETIIANLQIRYGALPSDGWQLTDYLFGFARTKAEAASGNEDI